MSKASKSKSTGYGIVARLVHWLVAGLFIGLVWLGWYMSGLSYAHPWYHDAPQLHIALGVLVFGLAVFKGLWRFVAAPPAGLESLKTWEIMASKTVHFILFAMMIILPVSGYLVATADGAGLSVFEIFEIPAIAGKSETIRNLAEFIHYYFAWGGASLVVLHVLAALKHHFIDKDATLRRMI